MSRALCISVATALTALVLTASTPSNAQQAKTHLGGTASDLVTFFAVVTPGKTEALQLVVQMETSVPLPSQPTWCSSLPI